MPPEVINASGLSCSYGSAEVLRDVSLVALKGDYIGIVGPNGSGKSTLIKVLLGLLPHGGGAVQLFGEPFDSFDSWDRIGYLPQNIGRAAPGFPATVNEIVSLGLISRKGRSASPKEARQAVTRVLEFLAIEHLRKKMIGELSGGQVQRVMLARALVNSPELLIMDEPSTALDPDTRERFYALVGRLNREDGTTVLLVTHDSGTIGNHATRMLYLDKEVVFFGSFDDFCCSSEMGSYFGEHSQHIICHRH